MRRKDFSKMVGDFILFYFILFILFILFYFILFILFYFILFILFYFIYFFNFKYGHSEQNIDLTKYDIHAVTGLLKLWLRELAEPIFTFELYDVFLHAMRIMDYRGTP